jgi:hypothetical protein
MEIHYEVAFRSSVYESNFETGLPGEQLARDLYSALEQIGYSSLELVNEAPFWVIRVATDSKPIDVLVSLFLPADDRTEAVWSVTIPRRTGFIGRLFGKPEEPEIISLLDAFHNILQKHANIDDPRWFKELPAEPYRSSKCASHPLTEA